MVSHTNSVKYWGKKNVVKTDKLVRTNDCPGIDPCCNGTYCAKASKDLQLTCPASDAYLATTFVETLEVLTIFIFAFTCQQNVFAICDELKDATSVRVGKVIGASIGSAWAVYMTVGVAGFFTFGRNVESNILVNYPEDALSTTGRVAIAFLVAFSYPLQVHPARKCAFSFYSATTLGGTPPLCRSMLALSTFMPQHVAHVRIIRNTFLFVGGFSSQVCSSVQNS